MVNENKVKSFICGDKKKKKICFFKRSSGVLMNISSLPGEYGIGTLGSEAREFADFLADMGFTYWQILPINPVGIGNSAYSSDGAFAGNYLYIDPFALFEQRLISLETLKNCKYSGSPYVADYEFAMETRKKALKEAFENASDELLEKAKEYGKENSEIEKYAEFYALFKKAGDVPLSEWENIGYDKEDKDYALFVQYLFYEQWMEFKEYVNSKGIYLVGDMPFYVSLISADVYFHKKLFKLDDAFVPSQVAGVPPDYFSEDGQLWGNPVYDWDEMEKDGYQWWIKRIENSLKFHDIVRIDHFRAFASYWSIPADSETAKTGKWMKGPGMKLFNALKDALGELPIIAEDLGEFGVDVETLLAKTGFPGMRVVQFGLTATDDSSHLPHNYVENTVAYTGTHDNNTLLGCIFDMTVEERDFALDYCSAKGLRWEEGGFYAPACRKVIETVWRSASRVAIVPFQDICGFGADTRMNIPGTPDNNWEFRTTAEMIGMVDKEYYKNLNKIFKR